MSERRDENNWAIGIGAAIGVGAALYAGFKTLQVLSENSATTATPSSRLSENIHIVTDEDDCRKAAQRIRRECINTKFIGFDILWTNNTRNRREEIGLLQLATADGYCALIRLCYLRGNIPRELKSILQDDTILKVGVGSHRDAIFLSEDYDIQVEGTLDLSELAVHAECASRGLVSLANELLGMEINEPKLPNWEKVCLTDAEIAYASDIAIACIKLYQAMKNKILARLDIGRFNEIEQNLTH